jgi:hypothetical protein
MAGGAGGTSPFVYLVAMTSFLLIRLSVAEVDAPILELLQSIHLSEIVDASKETGSACPQPASNNQAYVQKTLTAHQVVPALLARLQD